MSGGEPDIDVLIVGAGISGINAGCRLRERCPDKTFAILEARDAIGGTWDLFRFPGIRSDSDMFTLCYPFRPWTGRRRSSRDRRSLTTSARPHASTGSSNGSVFTIASSAPSGRRPTRVGPSTSSAVTRARRSRSRRASCSRARATTTTTMGTGPSLPASIDLAARSSIPSSGPTRSTTRASGSS